MGEETTVETDRIGEAATGERRRVMIVVVALAVAVVVVAAIFALRSDGPRVLALTGGGGAGGDAAATMAESDAAGRAEMTIGNPVEYRFDLGDGAGFDAGEERAWMLEPPSDLEAAASELADRLGLGAAGPAPHDDGSFVAGSDDGTGPGLRVGSTGDWAYHAPGERILWDCVELARPAPDTTESREDPESPESGDAAASDDGENGNDAPVSDDEVIVDDAATPACEPPSPPTGVPSESEVRSLAEAFFADLDLAGNVSIQDARSDEWGARVHATISLDGVPTELSVSAGWGGEAELTNASGTLAVPVEADRYPTIDADGAVERLEGRGAGWGRMPTMETMPLPADGPATTPLEPEDGVVDPDVDLPAPDAEGDGLPEGEVELETVTVTLVSVEPVLMLQWDADGTTWLLPGYRFTDADDGVWPVLAVADEYLETVEPEDAEPGLVDPETDAPGERGGGSESQPREVEPTEPGTGRAGDGASDGASDGAGDGHDAGQDDDLPDLSAEPHIEELAVEVVGMTEADAVERIEADGGSVRVVARDDEEFAVTNDYSPSRVNLRVADDVVVDASVG